MKGGIFQQDNPFNFVMTKIFDLALLNILWIICCIPIVTIGASTTALYYMTMKMIRDEETGIIKGFFKAFKENFRKSVPITLIMIVCVAVLMVDFHVWGWKKDGISAVMYGTCIVLTIIVISIFSYAYPLLAKFENTVKNTLVNAGKMAVTHIKETLIVVVVNCVPGIILLVAPNILAKIWVIWVIIGTSASALLNSYFLLQVFNEFIEKDDVTEEEL